MSRSPWRYSCSWSIYVLLTITGECIATCNSQMMMSRVPMVTHVLCCTWTELNATVCKNYIMTRSNQWDDRKRLTERVWFNICALSVTGCLCLLNLTASSSKSCKEMDIFIVPEMWYTCRAAHRARISQLLSAYNTLRLSRAQARHAGNQWPLTCSMYSHRYSMIASKQSL